MQDTKVSPIFPGWSFFRHNLTEERVEDLPPGKGTAAAMLLTVNGSHAANATWAQRVSLSWCVGFLNCTSVVAAVLLTVNGDRAANVTWAQQVSL